MTSTVEEIVNEKDNSFRQDIPNALLRSGPNPQMRRPKLVEQQEENEDT